VRCADLTSCWLSGPGAHGRPDVAPGASQVAAGPFATGPFTAAPGARVGPVPADGRRPQVPPVPLRQPGHRDPPNSQTRSATSHDHPTRPAGPPSTGAASREPTESYAADPVRVHHRGPPSRLGVLAVSVSLRHQRNSVTVQRPPPASRRSATGRTRSPLRTTATRVPRGKDR
jgi:hypothetical protein